MGNDEYLKKCQSEAMEAHRIKQLDEGLEKWLGKVVKRSFICLDRIDKEWMYVRITEVVSGHLIGTLLNSPTVATYVNLGDTVSVDEDEIISVAK